MVEKSSINRWVTGSKNVGAVAIIMGWKVRWSLYERACVCMCVCVGS